MIQASNAYKDAVNGNGRMVRARLYINGGLLDEPIGEVKFYRGCCGQKPDAGSIYVPYIDATIKGAVTASGNATLKAQVGFLTASDWEWVDVGNYVISRIDAQSDSVTIRGVGTLGTIGSGKANITESTYSGIANEIATATGIDVQFVGVDSSGSFENPPEGKYRDILAQIAYNLGGFLSESADGKWTIAGFCSGTAITVDPSRMQTPPSYGSESYSLNGVQVESAEIDLSMGNPLIDPWDYLVFGEEYARLDVNRTTGNLIAENSEAITGTIAFDDDAGGHLLYTYTDGVNVSFNVSNGHLFANQPNAHIVPCLQITHTLNGGCSTFIGAHVESAVEEGATIQGPLNRQVVEANAAAKEANEKATEALESVQETTNYFWANEEGAHVTKKTKAEYLQNPEAGGGNFLAQADKVAVRDGTKEMAAFGLFGQQMTNREGVRYFSLDSLNSTGDMFAKAGPFEIPEEGNITYAMLPVMPTSGKPIYTSVDGASGALFEMTAGTADSVESTRYGVKYTVTYDGEQTLTAQMVIPEHDEQERPAGTYAARISAINYWADTNMPSMTFGTSQGDRGKFSATFGEGLMAQFQNQVAVGMYNENISDNIFEVGGGTNDSTRKTLFAVEASGDIYCAGRVSAGGQIMTRTFSNSATSWSAGTAGTFAKQLLVNNINVDGYTIVGAAPKFNGHPSAYMFAFYAGSTTAYFEFFRTGTSAYNVPAGDAVGTVFYVKNDELT